VVQKIKHKKLTGRIRKTIVIVFFSGSIYAQDVFQPSANKVFIEAVKIDKALNIDGKLDEQEWKSANLAQRFIQIEPNQGDSVSFNTDVKILFNQDYLYVSAFCRDPLGKKGIRVPDLRRDFDYYSNDIFGLSIDAFKDERNSISFQTNPYGAQRDLQSFDDVLYDRDWDGLWKVRTTRSDSGWIAEIAIPWSTLRYPKKENQEWGINFYRNIRRLNELSSWSAFPRAYTPYRMNYAGIVKGLTPPPPTANIRIQPYTVVDNTQVTGIKDETKVKVGGEAKWAITPNTVLDATINTDFAQVDADRQVVNLTRFSIYFPERRQFFLENASLFSSGWSQNVDPFFSRRVGLDDYGNPIPIDAGLRLTNRTIKQSSGLLFVKQRETTALPGTYFGVGKYNRNFGVQNHIGALVTAVYNDVKDSLPSNYNLTGTIDGLVRLSQPLSWSFMVSGSKNQLNNSNGLAAHSNLSYNTNFISVFWDEGIVSKNYDAKAGFVSWGNVISTAPGFYLNYRPKWKPKFIRSFEPGASLYYYNDATTGKFLQREIDLFLFYTTFQSGGKLVYLMQPITQQLYESFYPLNIEIAPGKYNYTRHNISYTSDLSKKISVYGYYETGGYYSGHLNSYQLKLNFSPIPHIYFSVNYQINQVRNLGVDSVTKTFNLVAPEFRLAINPRLQLIGFYQYNETLKTDNWNVRFSWEFKPLSFVYLVFNNYRSKNVDPTYKNQQIIGKVTYLKQF